MGYAAALIGLFVVGVIIFLLGLIARRPIALIAGAKVLACAVVGFPLISAIARLIYSPLPPDAALAWRAIDILVSVVELLLATAGLLWIVRMRPATVDE
jgi:hypothetical protein